MNLERTIEALDEEWRTLDEFDAHLARLLRVDKHDTLTAPTTRFALDGYNVLEHNAGRVRKRPGFSIPDKADFAEIENRRLREAQERERQHFEALDRDRAAQQNPIWEAQRQVIRGVIDERLRELGILDADGRVVHVTRPGYGPAER